jgi:hypothetical protein
MPTGEATMSNLWSEVYDTINSVSAIEEDDAELMVS